MPEGHLPGLEWMVTQLLKDLAEAKMWPIKLAGVKCQETLRTPMANYVMYLPQTGFCGVSAFGL